MLREWDWRVNPYLSPIEWLIYLVSQEGLLSPTSISNVSRDKTEDNHIDIDISTDL